MQQRDHTELQDAAGLKMEANLMLVAEATTDFAGQLEEDFKKYLSNALIEISNDFLANTPELVRWKTLFNKYIAFGNSFSDTRADFIFCLHTSFIDDVTALSLDDKYVFRRAFDKKLSKYPPWRNAVFVLFYQPPGATTRLCGTAVAVQSKSGTALLCCRHQLVLGDQPISAHLYCTASVTKDVHTGTVLPGDDAFGVSVLHRGVSADIAVLQRRDGVRFKSSIPLCARAELPWTQDSGDSGGWQCSVQAFHCPIATFAYDEYMDYLACNVTGNMPVSQVAGNGSQFTVIHPFNSSSNGGAMVDVETKTLIGILCIPRQRTNTHLSDDTDELSSISSGSVHSIDATQATCIVPCCVEFNLRGNAIDLVTYMRNVA